MNNPEITLWDFYAAKAGHPPEWFTDGSLSAALPSFSEVFGSKSNHSEKEEILKYYDDETGSPLPGSSQKDRTLDEDLQDEIFIWRTSDWIREKHAKNEAEQRRFFAWQTYYANERVRLSKLRSQAVEQTKEEAIKEAITKIKGLDPAKAMELWERWKNENATLPFSKFIREQSGYDAGFISWLFALKRVPGTASYVFTDNINIYMKIYNQLLATVEQLEK